MKAKKPLELKGFTFTELLTPEGLQRLDAEFLAYVQTIDQLLHDKLFHYRTGAELPATEISQLIIDCAPILEAFIAELFAIEDAVGQLQAATLTDAPIFAFKKYFVLREARRALKKSEELPSFVELDQQLLAKLRESKIDGADRELAIASWGQQLLQEPTANQASIDLLIQWCVQALATSEGQVATHGWSSFKLPHKMNYANLVSVDAVPDDSNGRLQGPIHHFRYRDGFKLTDHRMSRREVMSEVDYCVYCHKTDGDFCAKGFPVKKGDPSQGLKINPVGETLTGCPLEEKISEMHFLKKNGYGIAALATVMIDNPMCPATGHRICNDCMKGCIYQKQEPVNIPQIETRVLTDVLDLPWGVEIYDLLTRWNPLRQTQWVAQSYNGAKVLVMGMGPAGFTLAHHLLMEGFAVVGTDGLKIEPLPQSLLDEPIYHYSQLRESLDDRVMAGFGGVAEYGITVRWDKNFLKLIYISLMRRAYFQVYGSVRFGGTITVEDAWELGFDHLAVAVGAGLPRELAIKNSLAPGMRQANDFLMALQLTGAAKASSLANLQVRLPAVVIGGGLTGVDTATEVQAYYIVQVEKILQRYKKLCAFYGEGPVRQHYSKSDLIILDEFIQHGLAVRQERENALKESRQPDFIKLIRQWGGVTIVYRRSMQESPAYKRNHEELAKALEEGIYYAEGLEPTAVVLDQYGQASALRCVCRIMDEDGQWMKTDEEQGLPAAAIFVATGAKPNVAYEFEHKGTFLKHDFNYQRFTLMEGQLEPIVELNHCKSKNFGAFTSYQKDYRRVTFLGDTHPVFHGSVVKAIASAKQVYPFVVQALKDKSNGQGDNQEYHRFKQQLQSLFSATVDSVIRHTPQLVELKVRAPLAAKNFRPGQFYRLQNYERHAAQLAGTRLQTETLAMIGARQQQADILSFMVLERGASSRLVATFKVGESVSVMGPTGARSKIPEQPESVMLVGGSMAAAHLRSIGPALRAAGCHVLYVSTMESGQEVYCKEELEAASDAIIWIGEQNDGLLKVSRPQDCVGHGELVTVLRDYAVGNLVPKQPVAECALAKIDRIIVVGAANLLRRLHQARQGLLKSYIQPQVTMVASVYGPMQCMLKGVCAQCLQWQIDPLTGKRTKAVYACSWQEQPLEMVDIDNIDERLSQNHVQETLTNLWLDYLFTEHSVERI